MPQHTFTAGIGGGTTCLAEIDLGVLVGEVFAVDGSVRGVPTRSSLRQMDGVGADGGGVALVARKELKRRADTPASTILES